MSARSVPEVIDESAPPIFTLSGAAWSRRSGNLPERPDRGGATVAPGDLLISGTVEYPSGTDPNLIVRTDEVRPTGRSARPGAPCHGSRPLTAWEKEYTGAQTVRRALRLVVKTAGILPIQGGISFADYDKITTVDHSTLTNGLTLPLAWETETYS